jgi:xanthine phosphoribosyltransferase
MRYYGFDEFFDDVKVIARAVTDEAKPDAIVAIARGGMSFGHFLAHALDMRMLFCLNSIHYDDDKKLDTIKIFNIPDLSNFREVLIVDDIVDSGETMAEIVRQLEGLFPQARFRTAALFYKQGALIRPDFSARETDEWVKFLWDFTLDGADE